MSDDLSMAKANRYQEAQYKQQLVQNQRAKQKFDNDYRKTISKQTTTLDSLQKDYEVQVNREQAQMQLKLNEMRTNHKEILAQEDERLKKELENLKITHKTRMEEIEEGNENQINDMNQSHKKSIEDSRAKYLKEKAKWKV